MKFPFLKEATKNLFSKPSTVEYPFKVKESPAKPGYHGRIAYDAEKCINCGTCQKVCCPGAITVETEDTPEGQKITYHFDLTSCTFCGTCQDFCDEGAITLTEDYHMVAQDPKDLIVSGSRIKQDLGLLTCSSDCIYCTLCARNCPHSAITVDRASKTWSINHDACVQCGLCVSKCPKKALAFKSAEEAAQMEAEAKARKEAEAKAAEEAAKAAAENKGGEETQTGGAEEGIQCNTDLCVYCTLCARNCPQEAITVDRANKSWSIDRDKCIGCELCVSKCPKKALSMN